VLERAVDDACRRFAYGQIRTPIIESTDVFVRTIGEGTDIVDKEMYTFTDRAGRSLTLRPEFTAPVVRAALEHKLLRGAPLKLYYQGPIFRYERPQKGRYRQSHQWGAEFFGVPGPEADAEIIALGVEVMRNVGIADASVEINSIGCSGCREDYRRALTAYFRRHEQQLSEASRERLRRNPLRILDSKEAADEALLAQAPQSSAYLCAACRAHFDALRELLPELGIAAAVNGRIVRGLDYYNRTVFEIVSAQLGAQNAICGGGRYDGLVESMGGPPTAGVGLAMGVERLLLAAPHESTAGAQDGRARIDVAFVALDAQSVRVLLPALQTLRARGVAADMDYTQRKLDKQLKGANDLGARLAVIVGSDERQAGEATIQDLSTRRRRRVRLAEIAAHIGRALAG
jgi:histidyl-tRNA synthetase